MKIDRIKPKIPSLARNVVLDLFLSNRILNFTAEIFTVCTREAIYLRKNTNYVKVGWFFF